MTTEHDEQPAQILDPQFQAAALCKLLGLPDPQALSYEHHERLLGIAVDWIQEAYLKNNWSAMRLWLEEAQTRLPLLQAALRRETKP